MSNHARANRIARTNAAASASLSSAAVDTNIGRVFIEAEDPPSELEILDELAKKGCMGTATQKKEKLLPYHQDYIDFAEKMKPHDPQLAERFLKAIPSKKQLTPSNSSLLLAALASKIYEMWKCLKHYQDAHIQKRMSREVAALWQRVYTNSISMFVETAKTNALDSRTTMLSKMTVKINPSERERLFMTNGGFQDSNLDRTVYICGQCKHSNVDMPPSSLHIPARNRAAMEKHREEVTRAAEDKIKAPPPPKTEARVMVCHCKQQNCFGNPSGPGNLCLIKCIDPVTALAYGRDQRGSCLCPICKCTCAFAVKVSSCFAFTHCIDI
jgi:hypothetical protein